MVWPSLTSAPVPVDERLDDGLRRRLDALGHGDGGRLALVHRHRRQVLLRRDGGALGLREDLRGRDEVDDEDDRVRGVDASAGGLPWSPNASLGVEAMTTRLPTFLPGSWLLNEAKRSAAPRSRPTAPLSQVLCATLPSRPLTIIAWIDTRSSLVTAAPSPSVTTLDSVRVTLMGAVDRDGRRLRRVRAGDLHRGERGRAAAGGLLTAAGEDERTGEGGGGEEGAETSGHECEPSVGGAVRAADNSHPR